MGRSTLVGGLAGGIVGGQLAALVALLAFGAGPGNTRLGAFLAGGVAAAIAVAASGRFVAAAAGAFTGEIVSSFYEQTASFADLRAAIGNGSYVLNGIGLGLAAGLAAGLFNRRTPARGLRWSWLGFAIGVGGGVLIGFVTWAQAGRAGGLIAGALATIVSGLAGGLFEAAAPTDLTKAASPAAVLARDRTTFLISLALAFPVGLCFSVASALSIDPLTGQAYGLTYGAKIGIANLIAIGLGFSFTQARWGVFTLARWWLAATRRLPFRLMKFLADAHVERGVLRQAGAYYQFRHAELQRRIGATSPNSATYPRKSRSLNAVDTPHESAPRRNGNGALNSRIGLDS